MNHRQKIPKPYRPLDTSRLIEVPADEIPMLKARHVPSRIFVDRERGWCVQVWDDATPGCDNTPWAGTLRISVNHTRAKTRAEYFERGFGIPITWDDLQAIKDFLCPDRIGLEIYPPNDKIVDAAEVRWLWVLPKGAALPFNLQASSINRLQS